MNQYDSPHRGCALCVWPYRKLMTYLVLGAGLVCPPAAAATFTLPSLNEASFASPSLTGAPCLTRPDKPHRYLFGLLGDWHHNRHDPDCHKQTHRLVPVLPPPPQPEWLLVAGRPVGQQLTQWGQEAGWRVLWRSSQDWLVPNDAVFYGSFTDASSQVLQDLATEGAPIHGIFYQGNQTLVITGDTP